MLRLPRLSKQSYILIGGSVALAASMALAASIGRHGADPVTLPEQTVIRVTLNQAVTSSDNRPGDRFEATVSQPVTVGEKTVIPRGAPVEGIIVDAHRSGRLTGTARLQLALESVTVDGRNYDVHTGVRTRVGGKHKHRNLALIGGGAGGGALIGALAGGGKGALIGGPIGAGAGTAVAFLTGKKDIRLPPETPLTFTLTEPVTIETKG